LRHREGRYDADRCLPVFLHMHRLRRDAAAEVGRLLRVLFLRLGIVSANSGRALGGDRPGFLLCGVVPHGRRGPKFKRLVAQPAHQSVGVVDSTVDADAGSSHDLDRRASLDGDGVHAECAAMRTHCRYTGPYYLAMIAPALILASGIVSADFYGWLVSGVLILGDSVRRPRPTDRVPSVDADRMRPVVPT
jgi:hypothetical protein